MNKATELCYLADKIQKDLSELAQHSMAKDYTKAGEVFDRIMGYTGDIKRIAHQEGK